MSKKRRESASPMPASSAGLMRFFQDEVHGIKIRPELVVAGAIMIIVTVILAHVMFPRI